MARIHAAWAERILVFVQLFAATDSPMTTAWKIDKIADVDSRVLSDRVCSFRTDCAWTSGASAPEQTVPSSPQRSLRNRLLTTSISVDLPQRRGGRSEGSATLYTPNRAAPNHSRNKLDRS